MPAKSETVEHLREKLKPGQTLHDELRVAATATHLGAETETVAELVEWAARHPLLDGSHRRGERAWHCMGQRVLSIKRSNAGVTLTAGIHYTGPGRAPVPVVVGKGSSLGREQFDELKQLIAAGITARLEGPLPIHRPDEHWLQAVIRQDPSLVGVEQPALRELPAWRPRDDPSLWGRGFIDLVGVDGHGDIRVVETKLTDNRDDLFVMQGLDYYVWARAYHQVLVERLGAPRHAALEVHYVVGDNTAGKVHVSPFLAAQTRDLDPEVRWRFQTVHDWYHMPSAAGRAQCELLPSGELP